MFGFFSDEYDFLPVQEPKHNRSPLILQEHKLGIESWSVKILFQYAYHRLVSWRKNSPQTKFLGISFVFLWFLVKEVELNWMSLGLKVFLQKKYWHFNFYFQIMLCWQCSHWSKHIRLLITGCELRCSPLTLSTVWSCHNS